MTFLKMRTETALKKNKSNRSSKPYKQASSIGVIFSVEDKQKHEDIKEFIHHLEADGKKVTVLEYLPAKKENHEFKFDFFTIEELSFWGNLNSAIVTKFMEISFDYLFYIDKVSNPLILYILAQSKAACRIGKFNQEERQYFEFMIEQNGTNKGLIDTMLNYIRLLR